MFTLLFKDEPEVVAPSQPNVNALSHDNDNPSPPSTPSSYLTHPAMYQALDVTEITVHIRQELRGFDLKSMVLVNRLWWKTFGPYLWENIYIGTDPKNDDRQVIFRNGLAARCLTLSIYDRLDSRGVAGYVAEKCRNITQLHLKLFSPDLVIIDDEFKQERCDNDPQKIKRRFALKEESKTDLLDNLFAKLPHVSELTISFADEGLQPEVLWSLTKLHRLRKLVINGGLRASKKCILRKNWKCNWPLLMRVARECQFLESLTVAWESRRALDLMSEEERFAGLDEMFNDMATPSKDETTKTRISIPVSEQVQSLRWLHISDCEIHSSLLDIVYASCPNLRGVGFKSVKVTPIVLEENVKALTSSCPLLRSFEFYDSPTYSDYKALLEGPLLNLSTLRVDIGIQRAQKFDGLGDLCRGVHSISNLDLRNIYSYRYLMEIMVNMTGLIHLKLSGTMFREAQGDSGYDCVVSYFKDDLIQGLRLPAFGCQDTLQSLDVTELELGSLKFHKLFFDRVQAMPQLKRLEISNRQVQDARIEETWTDPDEDPDLLNKDSFYPDKVIDPRLIAKRRRFNYRHFNLAYAHTKGRTRGPEGEELPRHYYWPQYNEDGSEEDNATLTAAVEAIPDKVFCLFPAVEFLYVYDDDFKRDYWNQEHYISEHIASALVRMMPKLKVMAYDKALGVGLRRVKKTYPHIIFDQIQA